MGDGRRVVRELTDEEQARLERARRETEAEREEILRAGREARRVWEAERGHGTPDEAGGES